MSANTLNRRKFLQQTAALLAATQLQLPLPVQGYERVRPVVVRIFSPQASKRWDYQTSAPWDHSVEPKTLDDLQSGNFRNDRYYEHINQKVVSRMLPAGIQNLTGADYPSSAWQTLLQGYRNTHRITIKINLNNASFKEEITTNRMDQSVHIINALIESLTTSLNVPEENITVTDPSRWIHPKILKERCPFQRIRWIDCRSTNLWDPGESVFFTQDQPVRPDHPNLPQKGIFHLARVYTEADHIINVCLLKNHGCGITGAMKNHFGAIPPPFPKFLHEGLGNKSYIADVCNTASIKNKVRVNICEAIFGNWHNNVWCPRPWKTFPDQTPNSLFFGTDPVAFDSVLLQHIADEVEAQGPTVEKWVREAVEDHQFLHYAMNRHKLGIHEHKPFSAIDYRQIRLS
jgi:hypothetical protein